jgi:hypothetical protein
MIVERDMAYTECLDLEQSRWLDERLTSLVKLDNELKPFPTGRVPWVPIFDPLTFLGLRQHTRVITPSRRDSKDTRAQRRKPHVTLVETGGPLALKCRTMKQRPVHIYPREVEVRKVGCEVFGWKCFGDVGQQRR